MVVMLNIFIRYISTAHMLLVWHRLQFESSGILVILFNQIDKVITRVYFLLLITNLVIFAKSLLNGFLFTQIISGILFCISLAIFVYAILAKTISLSILTDSESRFDPNYAMHWWNFYKHPLTAMAKSKLDMGTTEECKRYLNSRPWWR